MNLRTFFLTTLVLLLAAIPAGLIAQPGSQPFVFYGEEPWGGSYLGVDTRDVTPERLNALKLREETGVEITMVDQDAPAGKAGLHEHDVILAINDQKIESQEQLRRVIREIPAGRVINVSISRNGQPVTVRAQLAERKKMPDMDSSFHFNMPAVNIPAINIPPINMPEMEVPTIDVIYSPRRSGLMVENLTTQLGQFFGVKDGKGVLIRSVEKGSRGDQAGFKAGDVITKLNGSAVSDCSDFTRLLRQRTQEKASVTVMRDRKEQTLSLTLPAPKRTGALCKDKDGESGACLETADEIAAITPELAQQLRAAGPQIERAQKEWQHQWAHQQEKLKKEMERLKPEMERAQKEWTNEMSGEGEKLKKEMEKMQEDLREQQENIQQEVQHWKREADI